MWGRTSKRKDPHLFAARFIYYLCLLYAFGYMLLGVIERLITDLF